MLPRPPHRVTNLRIHTIHNNTEYNNESKHSEMGPVRQSQSRELLVCSYVRASHCAQLLHTVLQRTDVIVLAFTVQTINTTPIMSTQSPTVISRTVVRFHYFLVQILLSKYAIKRWFDIPADVIIVGTLPCQILRLQKSQVQQ